MVGAEWSWQAQFLGVLLLGQNSEGESVNLSGMVTIEGRLELKHL